jgi:hypothetical protein
VHRDDLMKSDLMSEIVVRAVGVVLILLGLIILLVLVLAHATH